MNSLNGEISSCLECYYHLSEGIRIFLIASDKWSLYQTNLYVFPPYKQSEPIRLTICKAKYK